MTPTYQQELNALIRTGIYRDTDEVLQDALKYLSRIEIKHQVGNGD